jgi:hypothetical protein
MCRYAHAPVLMSKQEGYWTDFRSLFSLSPSIVTEQIAFYNLSPSTTFGTLLLLTSTFDTYLHEVEVFQHFARL